MVEVVNVHFHRLTLVALELKSQFCWHKISYFLLLFKIRYLFGIFLLYSFSQQSCNRFGSGSENNQTL